MDSVVSHNHSVKSDLPNVSWRQVGGSFDEMTQTLVLFKRQGQNPLDSGVAATIFAIPGSWSALKDLVHKALLFSSSTVPNVDMP